MKQQENMILNQLNQYRNLYLQACNENTRLKHAMSKHEDELKANQSVIESLEDRIREQGEELIEEKQNIKQISEELDSCKKKLGEEREDHLKTKAELKQAKEDIAKLQVAKEAKELSEQANVDLLSVVQVLQRRLFQTNSDASSYMKGQVDFDEHRMSAMSFDDVVSEANKLVKELNGDVDGTPVDTGKDPELPNSNKKEKAEKDDKPKRKRNVFSIPVLDHMGIDTSNLPEGFKLIHRKDKESGADIWMVRMYECYAPLAGCIEYEIGRFNVPGHDPMCSKHPDHIIGKNPLLPSFARFYFDMKIHY